MFGALGTWAIGFLLCKHESEVPAPTCEVTVEGCEDGIEYEVPRALSTGMPSVCRVILEALLICVFFKNVLQDMGVGQNPGSLVHPV